MSIKIASALTLGIVVLAGGALFFWPDLDDEPQASAQEVVESACDDVDKAASYDFIGTLKHTSPGAETSVTAEVKGEVSGEDYHFEYTYEGALIRALRRVGDKSYATQAGGVWELYSSGLQDVDVSLGALGDTPICPDITGIVYKGDEELDGVKVKRYSSGDAEISEEAVRALKDEEKGLKNVEAHNYWVDVSGQLVQHQLDYFTLAYYDDIQISNGTITKRFLDIGEPNTITAPVVP